VCRRRKSGFRIKTITHHSQAAQPLHCQLILSSTGLDSPLTSACTEDGGGGESTMSVLLEVEKKQDLFSSVEYTNKQKTDPHWLVFSPFFKTNRDLDDLKTSVGDLVVDLEVDLCPRTSENFLKLCKSYYYNFCSFFNGKQLTLVLFMSSIFGFPGDIHQLFFFLFGYKCRKIL
jgi:hypothetical protein